MWHGLRVSVLALLLGSVAAHAQAVCTPEKLNAELDVYARDPFGALAWRNLNGLNNPNIDSNNLSNDSYEDRQGWEKLAQKYVPEMPEFTNMGYDCRITYPAKVLVTRVAKLGDSHPYIKQWFKAQAAVAQACSNGNATAIALPPPLETTGDVVALQIVDRAYQDASIDFYVNKPRAVEKFKSIGASPSPHKASARYNVANLLANGKDVVGSRKEANAILADASLASVHHITKALLGYIANLEDTPEGWTELLNATIATLSLPDKDVTATADSQRAYAQALNDIGYAGVGAKQDDWWVINTLPADATLSKALADVARKQPMALWMMVGQSVNEPNEWVPWALRGGKWQAWAESYVARAMALQPAGNQIAALPRSVLEALAAKPDDATRAKLWSLAKDAGDKTSASCGVAPETAALVTYVREATRLSFAAGKFDEIYTNLKALPLQNSSILQDVILPDLMHGFLATGNVEEGRHFRDALLSDSFLASFKSSDQDYVRNSFAPFLAFVAADETQWLKSQSISTAKLDSIVLNLLPAKKLRELSSQPIFDADQQALLARAAWTRNYARGIANSDATTKDMLTRNPALATAMAAVKTAHPKLSEDRVLLLTILRNPRFGILLNSPEWSDPIETKRDDFAAIDSFDHNDKNWWCPLETDRQLQGLRLEYDETAGLSGAKDYHAKKLVAVLEADAMAKADAARELVLKNHPMVKAIDWAEVKALAAMASAPKLLSLAAIKWAKRSTSGDGADEALGLAVVTTRYGCKWHGGHGAYSKAAQELLKAKFATSPWMAKTPYWFDCMNNIWDAEYNKVQSCKPQTWPKQNLPR